MNRLNFFKLLFVSPVLALFGQNAVKIWPNQNKFDWLKITTVELKYPPFYKKVISKKSTLYDFSNKTTKFGNFRYNSLDLECGHNIGLATGENDQIPDYFPCSICREKWLLSCDKQLI